METQALEHPAVLRFGAHFQVPSPLEADDVRNQRCHQSLTAMLLSHGDTLDDVTLDAGSGQDGTLPVRHHIIRINFLKGKSIVPEEAFHLCAEKRSAQRHLRYVIILILFHPFSKHSNTPGSACHGITMRMYGFIID